MVTPAMTVTTANRRSAVDCADLQGWTGGEACEDRWRTPDAPSGRRFRPCSRRSRAMRVQCEWGVAGGTVPRAQLSERDGDMLAALIAAAVAVGVVVAGLVFVPFRGGVHMADGGLPYDPEDGRVTGLIFMSAVSPNYPVNFETGRRARQQAADVVGGGLRGQAREIFLGNARTDPKTAAAAKRLAAYHNPRPKPDGPTGIDQVGNAINRTSCRSLAGLTGCARGEGRR